MDNVTTTIMHGDVLVTPGYPEINKSELIKCTTEELKQALQLASPSKSKDNFVANINAEIASIRNAKYSAVVDTPVYDEYGNILATTRYVPDARKDGIDYAVFGGDKVSSPSLVSEGISITRDESERNPPKPLPSSVNKGEEVFSYRIKKSDMYLQETVSGSDLSVFYVTEVLNQEDVNAGLPKDACRKNLILLEFDSVLSLSYSTIRERFPVRSIGSTLPKAMTSGIRTISGHIGFNIFAEDVLSRLRGRVTNEIERLANKNATISNPLVGKEYKSMLLDQLPPFHLLVMGVNESGILSRFMIKDIHIVDENQYQGTQQPNIVNKVTFVALDIVPMTAQQYNSTFVSKSLSAMEEAYVGGNWQVGNATDMTASSLLEIEADSVYRSSKVEGGY